jgi:hypothetical protein
MLTFEREPDSQSVYARSGSRFFKIVEREAPCDLSLTVNHKPKLEVECASLDTAKQLAQGWEQMDISVEDKTFEMLVADADRSTRTSLAKIELDRKYGSQGVQWYDERVSSVGRPARAGGYSYYGLYAANRGKRPRSGVGV